MSLQSYQCLHVNLYVAKLSYPPARSFGPHTHVFNQSGQLSDSNPCSEWEKLKELTLWSRITVSYKHCSLPLSPDPLYCTEHCPVCEAAFADQPVKVITCTQQSDDPMVTIVQQSWSTKKMKKWNENHVINNMYWIDIINLIWVT